MGHEKMQDLCRIHLINHLQAARSQVTGYATLEHSLKTNPCKGAGWPPPLRLRVGGWGGKQGKQGPFARKVHQNLLSLSLLELPVGHSAGHFTSYTVCVHTGTHTHLPSQANQVLL